MLVIETRTARLRRGFIVKGALAGGLAAAMSIVAAAGLHLALAPAPLEVHYTHRPLPAEAKPRRTFALKGDPTAARFYGPRRAAVLEGKAVGFLDLETGHVVHFEPNMLGEIQAMDAVGERIAVGDSDGGVGAYEHGVWRFLRVDGPVVAVALSPDRKRIAAATARTVTSWWIGDFERPSEPVTRTIAHATRLVFVGPSTVFIDIDGEWNGEMLELDVETVTRPRPGTLRPFTRSPVDGAHSFAASRIQSPVRFTPGGARLVVDCAMNHTVRLSSLDNGRDLAVLPRRDTGDVRSLDVSEDGQRVLVASRRPSSLELWDVVRREEIPLPH